MLMRVTGPLGTGCSLIRLSTHLSHPPSGRELPQARNLVLLGRLHWRWGYHGQSDWGRFHWEPDWQRHTCQPPGGDRLFRWPSWASTWPVYGYHRYRQSAGSSVNQTEGNTAMADQHVNSTQQHGTSSVTQPQYTPLHRRAGQQPGPGQQWVVDQQRG